MPFALVALVLIPAITGSLRLIEVARGPHLMPANPGITASPAPPNQPGADHDRAVMSQPARRQEPGGCRLRVKGHLDQRWTAWFDDLTLTRESNSTTILSGAVTDQAELHGLLTKICDLGITLISVDVIDPPDEATPIRSGCAQTRGEEPAECAPAR